MILLHDNQAYNLAHCSEMSVEENPEPSQRSLWQIRLVLVNREDPVILRLEGVSSRDEARLVLLKVAERWNSSDLWQFLELVEKAHSTWGAW